MTSEDVVYQRLAGDGDCGSAQEALDRPGLDADLQPWRGMKSPRNVLLYQAAIRLCQGEESQARTMYDKAAEYGWAMDFGVDGSGKLDCVTYKAVRSVLDQQDRERFGCEDGKPSDWPESDARRRTDPRTGANEVTTTTAATTTTAVTATTTAPATATTPRTGTTTITGPETTTS
jgi:hypothetical protein